MGPEEPDESGVEEEPSEEPKGDGTDEVRLDDFDADTSTDDLDEGAESGGRRSRVLRLARRLMDTREITTDTKEILGTVIGASDRAKTEAVRMAAREVRNYLDELKLKEDVLNLMTSYSLEISISLKPLADAIADESKDEDPVEQPHPEGDIAQQENP